MENTPENSSISLPMEEQGLQENISLVSAIAVWNGLLSILFGFFMFSWVWSLITYFFLQVFGFHPELAWGEMVIPYEEIFLWNKLKAVAFMALVSLSPLALFLIINFISKGVLEINHSFRYAWLIFRIWCILWPCLFVTTAIGGFFTGQGNMYVFLRFLQFNDHLILALILAAWLVGTFLLIWEAPRVLGMGRSASFSIQIKQNHQLFLGIFLLPLGATCTVAFLLVHLKLSHTWVLSILSLLSMSMLTFLGLHTRMLQPRILQVYKESRLYEWSWLVVLFFMLGCIPNAWIFFRHP